MKKFYMVFLENRNTPTFKHESFKSASDESKKLARLHKKKAYVLGTIKSFELNEFKEEDVRVDELPL